MGIDIEVFAPMCYIGSQIVLGLWSPAVVYSFYGAESCSGHGWGGLAIVFWLCLSFVGGGLWLF